MSMSARNERRWVCAAVLCGTLLVGCTVGPDFKSPAAPDVSQYTIGTEPRTTVPARGVTQNFETSNALPADWWALFASPALNQAITEALKASPTIAAAQATLKEARDQLKSGEGIFYPQVSLGAGAEREHIPLSATPLKFNEGTFNLLTLSAGVSYALDIWGGERRQVEGFRAEVDYQENSAHATALTLASNVANDLIALAAYKAEIVATNDVMEIEKKEVALAQVNARAGTAGYSAVLALESQLEATQAMLPPLVKQLVEAQDLLAVLEGKFPTQLEPPAVTFEDLSLPQKLPVSLPALLVRRRPDILEAEASLHNASAQIGVATAQMLPNITLSGAYGHEAVSNASFFGAGSTAWDFGAGLTQPIFEGGTLYFRRKAAIDAFDAARADYRQTVLSAFQQVADSLRALQQDAEALNADDQAVATTARSLKLTRDNYASGLLDYSQLLIVNAQYDQARIAEIEGTATRYQDTVALFAALGGGWWNDSEKVATQR